MGYCHSRDGARSGAIKRRSSLSVGLTASSGKSAIALVSCMSSLGTPRPTLGPTGNSATSLPFNPVLPPSSASSPPAPRPRPRPRPRHPCLCPHRPYTSSCSPILRLLPYSIYWLRHFVTIDCRYISRPDVTHHWCSRRQNWCSHLRAGKRVEDGLEPASALYPRQCPRNRLQEVGRAFGHRASKGSCSERSGPNLADRSGPVCEPLAPALADLSGGR